MAGIYFLYPQLLLLLLVIPLFIMIYFFGLFYNKKKAIVFANFEALERISDVEIFSKHFVELYFNIAILALIVFAIAGPVLYFNAETSSFSYVLAIDNSGSMKTADIYPNRLDSAKESAKRFVDLLPIATEISVLEFSGDAKILQEMDVSKFKTKLAIDSINFGNVEGTNIYNSILTANEIFGDRNRKALIIISDGQLNVRDTPEIIRYATKNSIIIYTIAIGTEEGGLTEFDTISKTDKDILQSLAFNTGGQFFEAESLDEIDNSFDELLTQINLEVYIDISFYLLLGVLGLFVINWLLHNVRFRTIP